MKHLRFFLVALLIGLVLALTGCGRDDLAGRQCTSNSECSGERVCVAGACIFPDDAGGDVGTDGEADGADVEPDVPLECEIDAECDPGEYCADDNTCQPTDCPAVACPDPAQMDPVSCECVYPSCESDADCMGGYICEDNVCRTCTRDYQCPDEQVCGDEGRCVDGAGCADDLDCASNEVCTDGICVDRPECLLDRDCDADEVCLGGTCTYSPECQSDGDCDPGYECISDRCYEIICRGPQDCAAGEICEAGECVVPPTDEVADCFVASQNLVVADHQRVRLEAFATDAQGNGVPANFEWTSTDPAVASINGSWAEVQAQAGRATITAVASGTDVRCTGEVVLTNPGRVTQGDLRVVVIDAETGAPLQGASVVIGSESAATDSSGIARLTAPGGAYTVSVFEDSHNYVSLTDVRATDIRIPLPRRQGSGPVAGFTGQFDLSRINTTGDVTLGLAGASIAGGLLDLNLTRLLGEPFVSQVQIPGQGAQDIPLPGGLVLFGRVFGINFDIKQDYYVNTSGGARLGWGMAGKVPARDLIELFRNGGGQGDVLTTLLPLFSRFDHAIKPLNLSERARVVDAADYDSDGDTSEMLPDYANFPRVDMRPSVRQTLLTDIGVSNFPVMANGEVAEVAVLVGGTVLDQPGFLPLGISATNDDNGDGAPDIRTLTMAPPHSSATGGRFSVVAISFLPDDVQFGSSGVELPEEISVALWNGQTIPTAIQLGTFPDATQGSVDDATRTVSVTADAGPLFRVRFVGADRTWEVWSRGPAGQAGTFTHDITVPTVASGRADPFQNGQVFVDAISSQVTLDDLVKATGIGLKDAGLVATSFSRTRLR